MPPPCPSPSPGKGKVAAVRISGPRVISCSSHGCGHGGTPGSRQRCTERSSLGTALPTVPTTPQEMSRLFHGLAPGILSWGWDPPEPFRAREFPAERDRGSTSPWRHPCSQHRAQDTDGATEGRWGWHSRARGRQCGGCGDRHRWVSQGSPGAQPLSPLSFPGSHL